MSDDRVWKLVPGLRAVNGGFGGYKLQQCWVDVLSGAVEWRDIPVYEESGGVVWADMSLGTNGE